MILNEPSAALRRVYFTIFDSGGALSTTATAAGAELQTSYNGGVWTNAAGTLVHVGAGLYYYQGTLTDVGTAGFLAIKFEKATFRTAIAWESIGPIFELGTVSAALLRLPIAIFDTSGVLVAGATAAGAELQTSVNGAAFGNAAGSLVGVGSGLYYYQASAGDVVTLGILTVKFAKASYNTAIATVEVLDPTAAVVGDVEADEELTPVSVSLVYTTMATEDHTTGALSRLCEQFRE